MIRGINLTVGVTFGDRYVIQEMWLSNKSMLYGILLGLYYVIVDIIPILYLSWGISKITTDDNNTKKHPIAWINTDINLIFTKSSDYSLTIQDTGESEINEESIEWT